MPAFLAVVLAIAVFEFGFAFLPVYAHRGRHHQLRPAQARRRRDARRIRARVHQPTPQQPSAPARQRKRIPWELLAADDYIVEAAGAAARRDRDALLAGLDHISRSAA